MNQKNSKNILFTRLLSDKQIAYGKHLGLSVTGKAFIRIEIYKLPEKTIELINSKPDSAWVFTSQNAVESIQLIASQLNGISEKKCYAVGEKTAEELLKTGITALVPRQHNSIELTKLLSEDMHESYIYFSGNKSQNTLRYFFEDNELDWSEIICYCNQSLQPDIDLEGFDAICFCSPSAVRSFFSRYQLNNMIPCFAIGNTTAVQLVDFSDHVFVSDESSVLSLLETCHNYLHS